MTEQPAAPSFHASIWSPGFQGLLWTNWLTAINDNVFRWFVIGIGKTFWEPQDHATLLAVGSALFVVPYILLASIAGWLADRFSKRNVIIVCKFAEIVIMLLSVLALTLESLNLLLVAVFFMGAQSALFAPSKIGTIPELLDDKSISAGNGFFNLATLSATVIGMGTGGWLADYAGMRGQENIATTTGVLVGIAVVGTLLSFLIKSLPAANRSARFPATIVGETVGEISVLTRTGPLFRVALGIVFFWSIAALAQINIDSFTEESGGTTESHRTPLLVSLVLGVGIGSVLAGIISAGRIELGLVPWGAMGMAIFAFLLWLAPGDFSFVVDGPIDVKKLYSCFLLAGMGISAGFFDVPLASYLQNRSPIKTRGKILAATNCLLFTGVLLMFGLFYLGRIGIYPGAFDNLSAELTGENLADEERELIAHRKQTFENAFAASSPGLRPDLNSFIADIESPAVRQAAVTHLLWTDIEQRKRIDEAKTIEKKPIEKKPMAQYKAELPSYALAVRNVVLQSFGLPLLSARQFFLFIALVTIPVVAYSAWRLHQKMARIAFLWIFKCLYRIRVRGLERIPEQGPAILVFNHCSWLDGATVLTLIPRTARTIAWIGNFKNPLLRWWANFCGVILMSAGPKSIRQGLAEAQKALENGELVAIFPEGGITQTGQIRSFKPGVMKIVNGSNAPVIPCYIDEMWGSIFSYVCGKVFNRFPNSFRRPLSLHIGQPMYQPKSTFEIWQAVQNLASESADYQAGSFDSAPAQLIRNCKKRKFAFKIGDSTGQTETGGSLLTKTLVLRRLMRKHLLEPDERNVGVLTPPSNGGVIVNLALALDKRVAINLNYSLSQDLINNCIGQAGIRNVLTSRKVMEKFGFELDANVIYLDDSREKITALDKGIAAVQSYAMPRCLLTWLLGLNRLKPHDLMTIIFTSGSTGNPKGVMLSQRNIATNMRAIDQAAGFCPSDTIIGILPFFHSFGYTATLWAGTACDIRAAYHFSPLEAQQVGKLVKKYDGTILVATPTFLRSYQKRCSVEEFKSLDIVVAGAERLPIELCDSFEAKFGVRPVEGYGATELSPITSVNIPPSRQHGNFQVDHKEGTVGRTLKSIACKVTDVDSDEELGVGQSGMLWITGPNVMLGYLGQDDLTAEVLEDGWYRTGDVAELDEDGFIRITGRMSRFSKIGGEMVPHIRIEELLTKMCDETPDDDTDDQPNVAVTAVPDEKKGERLIVLFTKIGKTPSELRAGLSQAGLPNIFIPSEDSFRPVDRLPLLGSGKLDLKGLKQLALELFAADD